MQQISRIPSENRGKHTHGESSHGAAGSVTPPSIQKIKWTMAISVENTGVSVVLVVWIVCYYLLYLPIKRKGRWSRIKTRITVAKNSA